ncbi:sensor histidine kinase [Paenibacillus sp. PL91]|uniref:sensor histidine kinase n=1 Tax=Paenibacillus sp. PL91 TaxID=2729538 RepID=UPI00145F3405|nr:sensor histidine kinase [Paenibacillus sp. PL91]MBC9201108.1 sensor histidine kinase [Paenibacillus sp. PL91]
MALLLRYVYDRKSWIVFYLLSLLFVDLLIWIDNGIAIQAVSLLYLNLLLFLAIAAFLGWRYQKEMKYARSLADLAEEIEEDWIETLPPAYFYYEETTNQLLRTAGHWYGHKLSAMKAAQRVEEDYVAAWVHEVKAPLTAMKMTIDTNRSHPAMRKMESEWLRIHLLIDQQLYISRLPSLEADYVLEQTGIQQLAALEVRELASWCVEKNIAVELEGEEAFVTTDRKWCRFIIRQILTNAVKYSPEGGMILLSAKVTSDDHVRLTIKDVGPGIAAHDLPRIFDKGFTGGNGRLQNAATGLGLYLARTVALKIGISLSVQSELRAGTEMEMTFPISNAFESVRA